MSTLAKVAIVLVAVWLLQAAWNNHVEYQQGLGYAKAVADGRAKQEAQEAAWNEKLKESSRESEQRAKKFEVDAATASAAADRLHRVVEQYQRRIASTPPTSCPQTANPLGELLLSCVQEYRAVAAAADGHANDAQTLADSWPE